MSEQMVIVDWPDAEGWWWCKCGKKARIFYAIRKDRGGMCILIAELGPMSREEFEYHHLGTYGPASFTRLLEANPFEAAGA